MKVASSGTYILTMINHKEEYHIDTADGVGIDLVISKSYENNLRERNPQLGRVEAVCDVNPLQLQVGDIVAVNHFTFYGDIGENKSFTLQPHFEYEGQRYFKVYPRQIYFKYNYKVPQPVGDVILCSNVATKDTLGFDPNSGAFFHTSEFVQRGIVAYGNGSIETGDEILTLRSAMYLITLDKIDYFKVLRSEVVGIIRGEEVYPYGDSLLVRYKADEYQNGYSPLLYGTGIAMSNNVTAEVVRTNELPKDQYLVYKGNHKFDFTEMPNVGDTVQVYRNQGVPFGDCWIVSPESVLYIKEEQIEEA